MEKIEELKKLTKPLIEWLVSNYNPMCEIRVSNERVEVLSIELASKDEAFSEV